MQTIQNKPHFGAGHCDLDTLAAWREQLALAARIPLKQQLFLRQYDYLPRFAQHYHKLRALPRRLRRSLQRQWKQSLAGIALLLTLGQAPALAETINVGGACTLVDAITAANSDTATVGCPAGFGADTIVLPSDSTQTLTAVNNTTFGATGLPVISSAITLQGNRDTITRSSSAPNFRIIAVNSTGNLTVQRTTISGGIIDRTMPDLDDGGGIANYGGTVALTDSTVTGNRAFSSGGGVYNSLGTMTLTNSTVSGNSADFTAGVFNTGSMTLTQATVSGNSAAFNGGGVDNRGFITLNDSTVSGNSSADHGGMFNFGNMVLRRTLVSGNIGGSSPEIYSVNNGSGSGGIVINLGFNLFGHGGNAGINFTPGPNDILPGVNVGAILYRLDTSNYGYGYTQTHDPRPGSPAIDAAGARCTATDQRGVPRPQGAACDIGAVEFIPERPTTCDGVAITILGTPFHDTLTGTPGVDVIHGRGGDDTLNGLGGNDILCGSVGTDNLIGGLGNDRLLGGTGVDTAQFFSSTTGVTVNLATGVATGLGSDTLATIENVLGTAANDTLIGNGLANVLNGASGNDLLTGATGNDTLIGGPGIDTAQFFGNIGVNADLASSSAIGLGIDTLLTIENLIGSNVADTLSGNGVANVLNGGSGNDILSGVGGNDTLLGGAGDDAMNGGAGTDTCNGQTGGGDSALACETVSGVP